MSEFTTETVRDRFVGGFANGGDARGRDFDLWLAGEKAKAVEEAQERVAAWVNETVRYGDADEAGTISSAGWGVAAVMERYRAEVVEAVTSVE